MVSINPTTAGPLRDRLNIFMINTAGTATIEEFKKENIRGVKVRFTPSSRMHHELSLQNPNVKLARQE